MSDLPMWPCPEVVSAPPYLLDKAEVCAYAFTAQIGDRARHPHQPGSDFCYEHMPAVERSARVLSHLANNPKWLEFLSRVKTTQAVRRRATPGANSGGVASLNQERRNGAQVRYPLAGGEQFSEPVPTIWTPKSCYPYPNHRRRLGLAGSYATSECQVLDVGWIPGQKPQKPK